jgi:HSP20 family molecular chaperone IbpA
MRDSHGGSSATDGGGRRAWSPVARVHRTDAELTFTVELPGVPADRVSVTAEHDVLTVHGTRAPRRPRSANSRHDARQPHRGGEFVYRFCLPPGSDPASIRADYADGTLAVHVPNPARFRRTAIPVALATGPAVHAGDASRVVPDGRTARGAVSGAENGPA